jgi:hypothetical protein
MTRTWTLVILLVVGVLCLIVPGALAWNPGTAKVAYGLGVGCLVALVFVLISGIMGRVEVRNEPRAPGDTERMIWASASFNTMRWYDWVGIAVPVFGGYLIGLLV